jgi:hypothetical protein
MPAYDQAGSAREVLPGADSVTCCGGRCAPPPVLVSGPAPRTATGLVSSCPGQSARAFARRHGRLKGGCALDDRSGSPLPRPPPERWRTVSNLLHFGRLRTGTSVAPALSSAVPVLHSYDSSEGGENRQRPLQPLFPLRRLGQGRIQPRASLGMTFDRPLLWPKIAQR